MKKFFDFLGFLMVTAVMILSGGGYAMAAAADETEPPANPSDGVGPLDGPGTGTQDAMTETRMREQMEEAGDLDFYQTQVDKRIVEMKFESCPIDQILRAEQKVNHSDSIRVEYYAVGQRPILTEVASDGAISARGAGANGKPTVLKVATDGVIDIMDTIMFPDVLGYQADGTTRSTLRPLVCRVVGVNSDNDLLVIAINGIKHAGTGSTWELPDVPAGAKILRLGRAAGEKDVETGSYYELPERSIQYCQRFIMQCEQSIIERMSAKKLDWTFTRQERAAMDDMRGGIERSGLFGQLGVTRFQKSGNIYTTDGIFWAAGKDIELGHWQKKKDENGDYVTVTYPAFDATETYTKGTRLTYDGKSYELTAAYEQVSEHTGATAWGDASKKEIGNYVYEYVISEKELHAFITAAIKDAGNASRTKLLFVDNLIYQALANLKSNRRIITQSESDYRNWKLDFESITAMGTKILIYRHDAFNYMAMNGRAFLLDPRYLEKWVFGDWSRKDYDLKDLFIRNSNAVVMEEFSCWTLYYPNAHARVSRPEFDPDLGETDELQVA